LSVDIFVVRIYHLGLITCFYLLVLENSLKRKPKVCQGYKLSHSFECLYTKSSK